MIQQGRKQNKIDKDNIANFNFFRKILETGNLSFDFEFDGKKYLNEIKIIENMSNIDFQDLEFLVGYVSDTIVSVDDKILSKKEVEDCVLNLSQFEFRRFCDVFIKSFDDALKKVMDDEIFLDFVESSRGLWKVFSFVYKGKTGSNLSEVLADFDNPIFYRWVCESVALDEREDMRKRFLQACLANTEGIALEPQYAKSLVTEQFEKRSSSVERDDEFKKRYKQSLRKALEKRVRVNDPDRARKKRELYGEIEPEEQLTVEEIDERDEQMWKDWLKEQDKKKPKGHKR